jgi:hypothetical protein
MMMCLYKTRQSILDNQPTITPCRQLILGGEVLLGITTNKFIKTDGSKVTTIIDPEITEIAPSYKRTKLTVVNSPYLRIQQAYREKRQEIQENRDKKNNIESSIEKEDERQWEAIYGDSEDHKLKPDKYCHKLVTNSHNLTELTYHVGSCSPKDEAEMKRNSMRRNRNQCRLISKTPTIRSTPHELWGSKWSNNSCASDSVTFALSVLHLESNPEQRREIEDQLRTPDLGSVFVRLTQANLSKEAWQEESPRFRNHTSDEKLEGHVQRGSVRMQAHMK